MKKCPKCSGNGCKICNDLGVIEVPKTIYLQIANLPEITWCVDKINDDDIEYIVKQPNKLSFDDAADYVMRKNHELYKRWAAK